jgi:uncharacterized membrane protein (DUF106 family)
MWHTILLKPVFCISVIKICIFGYLISIKVSHTSGAEVRFVPLKKIVPQKRAVSVAMDGPILSRILCSLMPISQLFCEKVAL